MTDYTPKAVTVVEEIPAAPERVAVLSGFEIRMMLRFNARKHHAKHAEPSAAARRAVCACGYPTGGPSGTPVCESLRRAERHIIEMEATIGHFDFAEDYALQNPEPKEEPTAEE